MNLKVNLLLATFNATIPAQQYGTMVQYRIYANDTDGIWAVSDTYSDTVIGNITPEIHFVQCSSLLDIYANATNQSVAVARATLIR